MNRAKKSKFTILLLSDGVPSSEKLSNELTSLGFMFFASRSREEAFGMLGERKFDLVVMLVAANQGEYMRLIKKIRRKKHTLPIIVVFDDLNDDEKVNMLDAGADEVLIGFEDTESMIEKIKFYLSISHVSQADIPLKADGRAVRRRQA